MLLLSLYSICLTNLIKKYGSKLLRVLFSQNKKITEKCKYE